MQAQEYESRYPVRPKEKVAPGIFFGEIMNQGFDYQLLKSIIETEFDFFTYFPLLTKSASSSGDRIIYMESSNEKLDLQGDVVKSSGIRDSLNFFLKCGKIDWDHKSLVDPRFLIGEPLEGKITDDGKFLAKAKLYKGITMADAVWDLLKAGASLGVSIGGKVLKAQGEFDNRYNKEVNVISKVLLNHLAVTSYPINIWTAVKTVPWGDFVKSMTSADNITLDKSFGTITGQPVRMESLAHGGEVELQDAMKTFINQLVDMDSFICPHITADGKFVNGRYGAKRHFVECLGYDSDIAEDLSGYVINNSDKIKTIVKKRRKEV